jgi:ABC-type glycerol-3-phosphate transport system substrate-binding protein
LYKEKIYGMPGGAGCVAMFYQDSVFQDAGIDPASVPDTPSWDQFAQWNKQLFKTDSSGKVVRIGVDSGGFNAQFMGVLEFEYYSADKTKIACNSPKSIEAVKKWHGLLPEGVKYDDISAMLGSASTSTPYADFGSGIKGMLFDGYWMFLTLDKYYPDMKYNLQKLPTPNGKKEEWSMYTGWVWNPTIPVGVKQADLAWKFIKYGFWSKGEMLADTINWTSSLKSFDKFVARTEEIMGENNREKPGLHHFTEMQYAGQYGVPYTPVNQEYLDGISAAYDQIVRQGTDPQAAMDEVAKTMQPKLDMAFAEG